ncbi:MAG: hypothetical protein VB096_10360 [Pseudoflavonifractor sp.]|nr:hypothetical protein [Pseudoflavonifractor sp.]
MNAGSITISTELDNKQLESELNGLTKKIDTLEDKINQKQAEKMPLVDQAQQLGVELDAAKAKLYEMQNAATGAFSADEIKEQKLHVSGLQSEWNGVQGRVERYDTAINNATIELDRSKKKAGGIAKELAEAGYNAGAMDKATKKAHTSMGRFALRVREVVRSALVFTLITQALAKFRGWVGKVIKTNTEASAAVARLKGALLTLAQPLVNVIIPAFTAFVNTLAEIVAAIASVVSALFGTTLEHSVEAAKNLNNETDAIDGVGAAAKKASKDLAAFDEINKLASDSAGGGGSSSNSGIAPDFSFLKDRLSSSLTFSLSDIFFKWDDLTGENILAKVITALTTLAGAVIGFTLGGPGGAAIGIAIGAGLGLLISNLIFDGDGELSSEEILQSVIEALGMLTGGILGFAIGGPGGAALGVLLGAGVALAVNKLIFNGDGKLNSEEILQSIILALTVLTGGILGFLIGGPGGAALGVLLGAGAALAVSGLIFNGDGVLSADEILSTLLVALGAVVGGIIGFSVGGPGGALVGVLIGGGAMLYLQGVIFDSDGKVNTDFLQTLIGALGIAVGGAIGFAVGGPGGALIGAFVGAGVSLAIETLAFSWDGKQAVNTILELLNNALFIALGGAIGFGIGGPGGALLGMAIAAGIKLLINNVSFSDETASKKAGYDEGEEVGKNVTQGTKDSLGVNSASSVYSEIGGNMMKDLAGGILNDEESVTTAMSTVLSAIETKFSEWQTNFMLGFGTFKTLFENEWKSFWQNQNLVFVNAWNDILTSFQNGINNAVNGLNKLVTVSNGLSDLTGNTYTKAQNIFVQKLAIPKLATGAVIPPNREFMAVLGDQKHGTNIEAPLDLIVEAFRKVNQGGGAAGEMVIKNIVELDGEVVFRNQKKVSRRHGTVLV